MKTNAFIRMIITIGLFTTPQFILLFMLFLSLKYSMSHSTPRFIGDGLFVASVPVFALLVRLAIHLHDELEKKWDSESCTTEKQ